jgi:AraC-like DNA-binding protein
MEPAISGLERSCDIVPGDWIAQTPVADGLTRLEAGFRGVAYRPHRHDTYAIGLTERGVQAFGYRGTTHVSTPGHVVILHPDELHDGYAGSDAGFRYRQLYVAPALISAAVRSLRGVGVTLPFAPEPVVAQATLAATIRLAFRDQPEPLAVDNLILRLADGLLAVVSGTGEAPAPHRVDLVAMERARQFLDAEKTRVVRSEELEAATGLTRYEVARQFRALLGTSPYRYLLMRRLDAARTLLDGEQPLVEVALATGFADQAHFTRVFTGATGISPGRYRVLRSSQRR